MNHLGQCIQREFSIKLLDSLGSTDKHRLTGANPPDVPPHTSTVRPVVGRKVYQFFHADHQAPFQPMLATWSPILDVVGSNLCEPLEIGLKEE